MNNNPDHLPQNPPIHQFTSRPDKPQAQHNDAPEGTPCGSSAEGACEDSGSKWLKSDTASRLREVSREG